MAETLAIMAGSFLAGAIATILLWVALDSWLSSKPWLMDPLWMFKWDPDKPGMAGEKYGERLVADDVPPNFIDLPPAAGVYFNEPCEIRRGCFQGFDASLGEDIHIEVSSSPDETPYK